MTVKNIPVDSDRSQRMVFVEFLEFCCRVAYLANFHERKSYSRNDRGGNVSDDSDYSPYEQKTWYFNREDNVVGPKYLT